MNLIEQIDRWAAVAPEATAHISDGRTLTYGELRRHSDALACYLTERLGEDRRPIAVLGHREAEMLIAFLGAVKSGRPYVPLDTALPQQRIDKILETSRAALVLTPKDILQFSASQVGAGRRAILYSFHKRQYGRAQGRDNNSSLPGAFHYMDARGATVHRAW